jgi:hypothetical protein
MDSLPDWAPSDVDLTKASSARVYDYFLGGAHNFAVDRELAEQVLRLHPSSQSNARANRAYLHRAVRFLLSQGVRQFIDIGAGVPTVGNVHETAPDCRVLYVDRDPVAVAHSELILRGNPNAQVLRADLRRPDDILGSPQLAGLIDLAQPVGVLMLAVLHFVSDAERPEEKIRRFHDAVGPGSFLVVSHAIGEGLPPGADEAKGLFQATAVDTISLREHDRVLELMAGWDLVEPGLVPLPLWRPDWPDEVTPDPAASFVLAGVGRRV